MFDSKYKPFLYDYLVSHGIQQPHRKHFKCPACGGGDNTPPMLYNVSRQKAHCFSCGADLDIFDFVAAYEGITRTAANERVESLYSNARESISKDIAEVIEPVQRAHSGDYSQYITTCHNSTGTELFFSRQRGLSREIINRYRLGFDDEKQQAIIPYNGDTWYIARNAAPDAPYKYEIPKGTSRPQPFNAHHLSEDVTAPLFVVEGEINALSVEDMGFPAVGVGSVTGWRSFLAFLQGVPVKRPLIVMLDNDAAGQKAQAELLNALKEKNLSAVGVAYKFAPDDINDTLRKDRSALKDYLTEIYNDNGTDRQKSTTSALYHNNGAEILSGFLNQIHDPNFKPTPTGFPVLDNRLGGGLYAGLAIIAAAPSEGKTTLAMQMVEQIAEQQKRDVIIFSFEMSKTQLLSKSLSRLTYENSNQSQTQAVTAVQFLQATKWDALEGARYMQIQPAIERYRTNIAPNVFIYDDIAPTTDAIMEKLAEYERERPLNPTAPPVVLIDYLQLIDTGSKDFISGCKDIIGTLKRYANEKNTVVFVISAVNREAQRNGTSMTSVLGSSFGEYGADYLLMLDFLAIKHRIEDAPKEELKRRSIREMVLTIQKNRMGVTGEEILLHYTAAYNHFSDKVQPTAAQINVKSTSKGERTV